MLVHSSKAMHKLVQYFLPTEDFLKIKADTALTVSRVLCSKSNFNLIKIKNKVN